MRAAAVQLNSGNDKRRNLEVSERLVRAAADDGARLIVLPEKWNLLGVAEDLMAGAEAVDGPSIDAARGWARDLRVQIVAGSIAERVDGEERLFNTSLLIDDDGEVVASYRKIHSSTSTSAVSPTASPTTSNPETRSSPVRSTASDSASRSATTFAFPSSIGSSPCGAPG